ncbi:hypothetical protein E2C01_079420 [Portunus trituberculatus]|uniref:Uncharacterized protein n=1 Tax=Portunus trituberculatus TaxID=210409 RepID=A0A5B7IQ99_PORTR|nr:hypothetical protein [Portunus trituberculatus]
MYDVLSPPYDIHSLLPHYSLSPTPLSSPGRSVKEVTLAAVYLRTGAWPVTLQSPHWGRKAQQAVHSPWSSHKVCSEWLHSERTLWANAYLVLPTTGCGKCHGVCMVVHVL